jgi:hypothetical protein
MCCCLLPGRSPGPESVVDQRHQVRQLESWQQQEEATRACSVESLVLEFHYSNHPLSLSRRFVTPFFEFKGAARLPVQLLVRSVLLYDLASLLMNSICFQMQSRAWQWCFTSMQVWCCNSLLLTSNEWQSFCPYKKRKKKKTRKIRT